MRHGQETNVLAHHGSGASHCTRRICNADDRTRNHGATGTNDTSHVNHGHFNHGHVNHAHVNHAHGRCGYDVPHDRSVSGDDRSDFSDDVGDRSNFRNDTNHGIDHCCGDHHLSPNDADTYNSAPDSDDRCHNDITRHDDTRAGGECTESR